MGRTGTDSLREALNILELGPCYHMKWVIRNGQSPQWIKIHDAVTAGASDKELKQLFDDAYALKDTVYRSAVDAPTCVYYKELMRLHPEAKIVLTVRDSADAWYKSVRVCLSVSTGFHHNTCIMCLLRGRSY